MSFQTSFRILLSPLTSTQYFWNTQIIPSPISNKTHLTPLLSPFLCFARTPANHPHHIYMPKCIECNNTFCSSSYRTILTLSGKSLFFVFHPLILALVLCSPPITNHCFAPLFPNKDSQSTFDSFQCWDANGCETKSLAGEDCSLCRGGRLMIFQEQPDETLPVNTW